MDSSASKSATPRILGHLMYGMSTAICGSRHQILSQSQSLEIIKRFLMPLRRLEDLSLMDLGWVLVNVTGTETPYI